jgi:predicted nucleic acid-binding protein
MPYLIDTTWLIDHLADKPEPQELLMRLAEDGIAMSIISYLELYQGVVQSPDPEAAQTKLTALVATAPILPFTQDIAETCARIRAELQARGRRIRPRALDLQIAATAIAYGLTLVAQNTDDYADIPGLQLYPTR